MIPQDLVQNGLHSVDPSFLPLEVTSNRPVPLLTKPSPPDTEAGTVLLQEPSYICAAKSVPTAAKAGPDDATETDDTAQCC